MTYACLLLPFPPTVNNLFSNFTRKGKQMRVPTKGYVAWQVEALRALDKQEPLPTFDGPISVTLSFGRPDKRRRDLFNYEKAVSDTLVLRGVIADDSLIEKGTVQWTPDVTGVRIEIESIAA